MFNAPGYIRVEKVRGGYHMFLRQYPDKPLCRITWSPWRRRWEMKWPNNGKGHARELAEAMAVALSVAATNWGTARVTQMPDEGSPR